MGKTTRVVIAYNHFPEIARKLPVEVGKVVDKTAKSVEADVKVSLNSGGRTGRVYRRGESRFHQASAPGEPPATDMGLLANSIKTEMTSRTSAVVSVGAEYGIPLEYGTRRGLAPRPFMRPAAERVFPWFVAQMKRLEEKLR